MAPMARGAPQVETVADGGGAFFGVSTGYAGDGPPQTTDARSRKLTVTLGRRRAAGLSGRAALVVSGWSHTRERDGDQRGRSLAGTRCRIGDPALAGPLDPQQLRAARL